MIVSHCSSHSQSNSVVEWNLNMCECFRSMEPVDSSESEVVLVRSVLGERGLCAPSGQRPAPASGVASDAVRRADGDGERPSAIAALLEGGLHSWIRTAEFALFPFAALLLITLGMAKFMLCLHLLPASALYIFLAYIHIIERLLLTGFQHLLMVIPHIR